MDNKGPRILVYEERGFTIAYWQYGDMPKVEGWWVDLMVCTTVLKGATHWMALPDAPGDGAAKMGLTEK